MANYSLIINSRFSPFSYQEMLAPVLMATQAHQDLENQYGELATKASVWEEMANEQTDPYAYKMYKTYADDLEKQAGQLAREGLNATSRRNMLNMRARYAKEITPIEQAYNTRQRQAEQQQQALLQNPTLMLSRRAATTSLDKYIENPNLDYESYSGALLTQQVGQAAAAIAKELKKYGKGESLDGFTRTWLQQHGHTAEEVALAINNPNDPKSSKVLNTIVNNVIADSGISKWADDKTLNQAYSYARQGLWQAVGQTQVGTYTDQAAVMRAQEAMQRRAEARARRAAREAAKEAGEREAAAIRLSGISFLKGSGTYGKYLKALSGLKAGQQAVKASIFGKHGTVNPLTVYDEYRKAGKATLTPAQLSAANRRAEEATMKKFRAHWGTNIPVQQRAVAAQWLNRVKASELAGEYTRVAREAVLNKYGVTQVITSDQYNAMKAIGYKGGTTTKYSQLIDPLNTLAQERSYYSTNMSGYDIPDQIIRAQLGNWNTNGNFSTAVYKLNADGTQGRAISYKDLKLADGTNNTNRKVTGIYYSAFTPGKIIVQIGESGDRYLMDPNVLGSEVAALVGQTKNIIASDPSVNLTEASVATTTALGRLLNSYNPIAPKSSKD